MAHRFRTGTLLHEQACISRSARGAVWGVLTCLFVLSRYKGPKIFFACGAPRIPLEISKETVFSLQCFSFGPGAVLGGAYMLVRRHACSCKGVLSYKDNFIFAVPESRHQRGGPRQRTENLLLPIKFEEFQGEE